MKRIVPCVDITCSHHTESEWDLSTAVEQIEHLKSPNANDREDEFAWLDGKSQILSAMIPAAKESDAFHEDGHADERSDRAPDIMTKGQRAFMVSIEQQRTPDSISTQEGRCPPRSEMEASDRLESKLLRKVELNLITKSPLRIKFEDLGPEPSVLPADLSSVLWPLTKRSLQMLAEPWLLSRTVCRHCSAPLVDLAAADLVSPELLERVARAAEMAGSELGRVRVRNTNGCLQSSPLSESPCWRGLVTYDPLVRGKIETSPSAEAAGADHTHTGRTCACITRRAITKMLDGGCCPMDIEKTFGPIIAQPTATSQPAQPALSDGKTSLAATALGQATDIVLRSSSGRL